MTEEKIITCLCQRIDDRRFPFQLSNVFIYNWECDYWTMTTAGETREYEIKISRSDYFKDKAKAKHAGINGANFFYYVVPKGLIKKEEVDRRYGLIYVDEDGMLDIIKKAMRLNSNVFDGWKPLATKMYWRYRNLWRQALIDKQITYHEYLKGKHADNNSKTGE